MAKNRGKHTAKRGQIARNKHQARRNERRKRLYNHPWVMEEEAHMETGTPAEPEDVSEAPTVEPEPETSESSASEDASAEEGAPVAEETTAEGEALSEEPSAEPKEKGLTFSEVFEEEDREEESRRRWRGLKITAVLITLAILLGAGYVLSDRYLMSPNTFQKGSSINDVDVSGLTEEQAQTKVRDYINSETLRLYQDGEPIGTITDFEFNYDFGNKISQCLYPGFPRKLTRLFNKDQREYEIELKPINQNKNFNKQFKALDIVKHAKGTEETRNAYVDMSTHDFNVVSEVYGNGIDTKKLKQALMDSIGANEMEFQYDPDDFRLQPEIKANSPEIQKKLEYCKKYLAQEIKLNTFKGSYTIPPKEMNKFIKADAQGNRVIKKKKLKKFVKKLRENFSVSGGEYDLDLVGGHVHVSGGNYGVYVDTSAEYKRLKKDFAAGTNIARDLLYEGGRTPEDGNDIGSSYVEIDISKQKLWCVVDGKTVVKSDVVTGNESAGNGTPTGLYTIAYKVSPCTLRGENADGSKYESKVSYWMPFNGGIGCHDATWRGSFGGSIYRYSGSHGCVNMPYGKAEELYYNVDAGMPVVVHN